MGSVQGQELQNEISDVQSEQNNVQQLEQDNVQSEQNNVQSNDDTFVHPLDELIRSKSSESKCLEMLNVFCGKIYVGKDENGVDIYETVDPYEFFASITQLLNYSVQNNYHNVIDWILENYILTDVSYDNNFIYRNAITYMGDKASISLEKLAKHSSFNPDTNILLNILSRSKYDLFCHCLDSVHLNSNLRKYKYTLASYVKSGEYKKAEQLLTNIEMLNNDPNYVITDPIYTEIVEQQNVPNVEVVNVPFEQEELQYAHVASNESVILQEPSVESVVQEEY